MAGRSYGAFPAQPLLAIAARLIQEDGNDDERTLGAMAAQIGVSVQTIHRWRSHGMTITAADRAAVALGLHPLLVWPEFLDVPGPDPGPERPPSALQGCGTDAGDRAHRRRGERPCDACRKAHSEVVARRQREKRAQAREVAA